MQTLIVPEIFFDAPEYPRCCLFTGRTDGVIVEPVEINFGATRNQSTTFQVRVPQTPFPWYVRLIRARIFAVLPLLIMGYMFYLFFTQQGQLFVYTFALVWISFVSAGLVTAALNLWLSRRYVTLGGMKVAGEVLLRFPPRQAARFELYRQALQQYETRCQQRHPSLPPTHSGDWTAHPESTWQQPPQFEPDPDAETVPPYRLTVSVDFMNSRFLPHRCLYTGRTDRVDRILSPLTCNNTLRSNDPVTVALPQAPGAARRWATRNALWLIVFAAITLPMTVVALFGDHTHDRLWGVPLFIGSLIAGAGASLYIVRKNRNTLVTCNLTNDRQHLDLTFPARHRENYLAFRAAWLACNTARRKGELDAPNEPGDDPIPGADEAAAEDWVDHAGADTAQDTWDETKPQTR